MPATATRTDTELIAEDLVKTHQTFEYTNIVSCYLHRGGSHRVDPTKFRVRIKRDAYEFQSFARVEVWAGGAWSLVHALPGEDARVADLPTAYIPQARVAGAAEQFADLATALLDLAVQVVA